MLFSYGYGQQQIDDNKKCRRITGDFDCHTDAAVQCGAHCPIEHVQGFTRSLVDKFVETTLNTNKTQLLPSNCGLFYR